MVETNGGAIWQRIPSESHGRRPHAGRAEVRLSGLGVLGKVQVINDMVEDHPFLIVANCSLPERRLTPSYDANLDGHRVTMAATGYFHDGKAGALRPRDRESLA